ncbi:formyl transferase [Paraburkholderia sp. Ac-20336]|uniref:methionyl-tRNA formyltransferase n=1 Tax=Paraburkholderia sp. Ac-20336 TaxID=2703886 RepID=UPI0019819093|nr:formyltransferase family protein [Paraburkholderia sp. Ac-20336]MBN3806979.1 formyl transferase [Paraburkholderia sp. Ac-20336]
MRFAFAGFDRWRVVFDTFVAAGWEPVALYTIPVDNQTEFNSEMVERAAKLRIPARLSRIDDDDLRWLASQGCDALVVSGYDWRIPDWRGHLRYAMNFHPSPLPEGRGPYPVMRAILDDRRAWGISCHRLDAEFDAGNVLAAETFPLDADEWHEALQLKLQMAAGRLASRVARDFERLWHDSRPQQHSSYWPKLEESERTLDFTRPVADAMRIVRALGQVECLAPLFGTKVHVRRAMAWQAAHDYPPGQIVHQYHRWIVVAAADGFVALLEWSPFSAAARLQMRG